MLDRNRDFVPNGGDDGDNVPRINLCNVFIMLAHEKQTERFKVGDYQERVPQNPIQCGKWRVFFHMQRDERPQMISIHLLGDVLLPTYKGDDA